MVGRRELTDKAWAVIEPLLPANGGGRRWRDHRQMIKRDLVEAAHPRTVAGPARTQRAVEDRPRTSAQVDRGRHWGKILQAAIVKDDAVGDVEWVISIDSTVDWAHQHAAGARKKGLHTR